MGFGCIRAFFGVEKTGFTPSSRQGLPREFCKSADSAGSTFLVRRKRGEVPVPIRAEFPKKDPTECRVFVNAVIVVYPE
jgi:hypothetical protein